MYKSTYVKSPKFMFQCGSFLIVRIHFANSSSMICILFAFFWSQIDMFLVGLFDRQSCLAIQSHFFANHRTFSSFDLHRSRLKNMYKIV